MKTILPIIFLLVPILSQAQGLKLQSENENGHYLYQGEITLTGSYYLETDSYDGRNDGLNFVPDEKSTRLLPPETLNSAGDSTISFSNVNQSLKYFNLNPKHLKKGYCYDGNKATITIKNYIFSPISWGWRSATLISVKDVSKPKIIKCNP